ncbi:interleukin-15 receptor subunit alpha [Talpa occidentalis]|uniref:interleukin-15 receptor subunit alpha n=1 Tax=Talpa occidentalis TaxID=50954 RepID=UPI0023F7663C|nr:interleukin-15 receptor subunit alpha [Talpa occidentalis]
MTLLSDDIRSKEFLGSPGASREEKRQDPGPPQLKSRIQAPRAQRCSGDPGGVRGVRAAAGAFSRGGVGAAESWICHCFSPLPSPPGAKAKAKANATRGAASTGSCTRHLSRTVGHPHARGGWASRPVPTPEVARWDAAESSAMARRRLQGCGVSALLALLLLLLGPPVTPDLICPTPTSIEHADIRVKSYSLNSRERYICNSGFKRKAGTSNLIECVFNKTINTAHWTTPNLKCIRDPSLSHQKSPTIVAPPRVTPEQESPSPSGTEPSFTFKSDTTVATKPATVPGSKLTPSKPPSAGTTEVVSNKHSQAPSQTTTKSMEHTTSTLPETPGAHTHSATSITGRKDCCYQVSVQPSRESGRADSTLMMPESGWIVAISVPVIILCGAVASFLACHKNPRQTFQIPSAETENTEDIPMTREINYREEDTESYAYNERHSMENQRPARAPTLL